VLGGSLPSTSDVNSKTGRPSHTPWSFQNIESFSDALISRGLGAAFRGSTTALKPSLIVPVEHPDGQIRPWARSSAN